VTRHRRSLLVLVLLLTVGTVGLAPDAAGAAPEATCSFTWGSTDKVAGPATSTGSPVRNVRTGRHECYDRLVVDLGGPASGYSVRYVRRFRGQASNNVIPLPAGARIEIIVKAPVGSYGGVTGQPLPGVTVAGYDTFRSTRFGEAFEGTTQLGLGVRARLPFRVLKIGDRVVIDVAHHW
jgi:hypothetical protein